jgi:hypothetical protein
MQPTVVALMLSMFCYQSPAAAEERLCALYWPSTLINTTEDLKISEIKLTISCGEIRSISYIPSAWNIEITGPITTNSELHASPQPGGSWLPNALALQGAIVIAHPTESCFDATAFDVTAEITAYGSQSGVYRMGKLPSQKPNSSTEGADKHLRCVPVHEAKR